MSHDQARCTFPGCQTILCSVGRRKIDDDGLCALHQRELADLQVALATRERIRRLLARQRARPILLA